MTYHAQRVHAECSSCGGVVCTICVCSMDDLSCLSEVKARLILLYSRKYEAVACSHEASAR